MSVRKRNWTTTKGEPREAWLADYVGQDGVRHVKTFDRRKDADAFINNAKSEVIKGVHTADFDSVTIAKAGDKWLSTCAERGLERATLEGYQTHVELHIVPLIGKVKLSRLTPPMIREFEDRLRAEGRSPSITRKIMTSLSSLLGDAMERGLVARNVVRELGSRNKGGTERGANRHNGHLRVGVDIPTREEIKAIVASLSGFWRPIILTAIFTGLRASELRGLRWVDVDLAGRVLHVRQRADKFNAIGSPKSASSARSVPLPSIVVDALHELQAENRGGDIVFMSPRRHVLALSSIVAYGWQPVQIAAGVVDKQGNAKYPGLHALRHFYASWCINAEKDGGQGLTAKAVQGRLGHSTVNMTLNVYSHLFPAINEQEQVDAAQKLLLT